MSLDNQGRVLAERRLSPTGNGGVMPSGLNAPWDARTIQTQFHHAGRCGSRTRTPYIQDIDNKCPGMSVRVFVLLWNQTPVLGQSRRNQSRMVTAHTASDLVNARDEHWSMRPHSVAMHLAGGMAPAPPQGAVGMPRCAERWHAVPATARCRQPSERKWGVAA